MSLLMFQKNNLEENDNEFEQQNLNNIDNEQYTLFNGQEITPQGNDINELDLNDFISGNPGDIIHNQSEVDDEEYASSMQNVNGIDNIINIDPAPLRPRLPRSEENSILNRNMESPDAIIKDRILEENNSFKDGIQVLPMIFAENNEEYISNQFSNDFSVFSKDIRENEPIKLESSNYNQTPFPRLEGSKSFLNSNLFPCLFESHLNLDIKDAPVNKLSNSSSSQDTNGISQLNINSHLSLSGELSGELNGRTKTNIQNNKENITNKDNQNDITKDGDTKKKKITKITQQIKNQNINRNITKRRIKADSLRKKIKSRMHKKLRNIINKKLKDCGSEMFFELFPQPFTTNINIEHNKKTLKLTMKNLFKLYFGNKAKDREKVETNIKVIQYLDKNPYLKKNSGIDIFLESTYEKIIEKYLESKYFKEDIEKLYSEGETQEYIDKYRFIGKHWIEFYNNNGRIL